MEAITEKYKVSEIWIYPVKSLSGIKLKTGVAERTGFRFDRRWLIVDSNNRFLTQREYPEMALIQIGLNEIDGKLISMDFSHKTKISQNYSLVNPVMETGEIVEVQVWDDYVNAVLVKDKINTWLSEILGISCRLVYMPETAQRKVDANYAVNGYEITSFSDGYPYLIIGEEALYLLNSKLENKISINRFRPNLVFNGGLAHEEDNWNQFEINGVLFHGVKNCARCPIPTIDPETSIKGKEPLKKLSKYRFRNNKIYFGQNLLIINLGIISVGDQIKIISRK